MHHGFALRYLADVMQWPPEVESHELNWLGVMSEFKYDSYHDFLSGSRFAESLLAWLQQFEITDRAIAYKILKEKLIFVNLPELQHLVRRAFPAHILPCLESRTARILGCPRYLLRSNKKSIDALNELVKRTLFIALSDGARIDYFRRATNDQVSNEQVLTTFELSDPKWTDLHEELMKRTGSSIAKFEALVLIDDFTASGTTLVRQDDQNRWKGKLKKISCDVLKKRPELFSTELEIILHHYLGTQRIYDSITTKLTRMKSEELFAPLFTSGGPVISFGMLIHDNALVLPDGDRQIDSLLDKHFDPAIMTKHLLLGGKHVKHGFAGCGLPLIIEHNTPNNSLGILWAESPANSCFPRKMRPLFRRRQRHN